MNLTPCLNDFPFGACGDTTLLIAKYLEQNDCGKFDYVLGYRGKYSHAWLVNSDGVIVDITANQFDDNNEPVIVSCSSEWHKTFKVENIHHADFTLYDEGTASILSDAYRTIIESIEIE